MRIRKEFQTQIGKSAHLDISRSMRLWFHQTMSHYEAFFVVSATLKVMRLGIVGTVLLGTALAVTHSAAVYFSLYWYIWWFDMVMHTLGGIFLIGVLYTFVRIRVLSAAWLTYGSRLVGAIILVLISWEVFGVWVEGGFKFGWLQDTILDVGFGILGALIGYWLIKRNSAV